MTQEEITFLNGAGIETDINDSVTIGYLVPTDAPAGIDAVMDIHIQQIDKLIRALPQGSKERKQLLQVRGFLFTEFLQLFTTPITEQSFKDVTIFQVLHLQEKERKRLILKVSPTYEEYLNVLSQVLVRNNAVHLPSFFFRARFYGSSFIEKGAKQFTRFDLWCNWCREKQINGTHVF